MRHIIRQITSSTFLRHNAIFFVGSTAVSFLNYLYYPVLGRLLAPADFGEVQAVISFFLQTGVFLQVLGLVTIGVMKRLPAGDERLAVLTEIERLAVGLGTVICVGVIIAAVPLQHFLNFASPVPFMLLAVSALLGVPGAFSNAYIQGERKFGRLSATSLLGSSSKLLASVAFVLAGLRATGAVLGVVVSQVLALVYSLSSARRLGYRLPPLRLARPNFQLLRPELPYAGLVLATSLTINVLLSVDIIMVKHYFSPQQAGLYAGIATVARIIFFLTGPLPGVLIASVALGQPDHNRALLRRSMVLLLGLGGGALVAFALFPQLVVGLLVGHRYVSTAHLLPMLSLAIFILSAANLLINYHIALRHYRVLGAALAGLVLTIGLLVAGHATLDRLILSLVEGSGILLAFVISVEYWPGKRG